MSTSKYLCKKEDESYYFSWVIRCNPKKGRGETSKGGHTGTPTADSEQEYGRDRCKYGAGPPAQRHTAFQQEAEQSVKRAEGPRAQKLPVCKRTFEIGLRKKQTRMNLLLQEDRLLLTDGNKKARFWICLPFQRGKKRAWETVNTLDLSEAQESEKIRQQLDSLSDPAIQVPMKGSHSIGKWFTRVREGLFRWRGWGEEENTSKAPSCSSLCNWLLNLWLMSFRRECVGYWNLWIVLISYFCILGQRHVDC